MAKNYYNMILKDFHLNDEDVINVYPFGSKIYKSDNPKSDWDFIVVVKDGVVDRDLRKSSRNQLNINIFQESRFLYQLERHRMSALECIFLPSELILKNSKQFNFKLNLEALKLYALEKSKEDWQRALKLSILKEPDLYIKSVFHAIRTLDFAKQIIDNGRIIDYASCNYHLIDLLGCKDASFLWDEYTSRYYEDEINNLTKEIMR